MSPELQSMSFAFPGSLATRTGGYIYDARVIDELRTLGIAVREVSLPESFPAPTDNDLTTTAQVLGALPPAEPLMVDGLAFGVMDKLAPSLALQRRLVALVHHPLAYETGLSEDRASELTHRETTALRCAAAVVVTSPTTARLLTDEYNVPEDDITVAVPGTERRSPVSTKRTSPPHLLAVGSVVPRKDFETFVNALAAMRDRDWVATIAGSLQRDTACAENLRKAILAAGLNERITLAGELKTDALDDLYARADVFVSTARYEGYGMALMDAVAFGLPIVATSGGAVAEVVPANASLLSPPGDADALGHNLEAVLRNVELRQQLAAGARRARENLPTWQDAASSVARAVFG